MRSVLTIAVPLAFFGLFALSALYVGLRLSTLFHVNPRWPIVLIMLVGVFGSLVAVGATARATGALASLLHLWGGWLLTFHLFALLALLLLQGIQTDWQPSPGWAGVATLLAVAAESATPAADARVWPSKMQSASIIAPPLG